MSLGQGPDETLFWSNDFDWFYLGSNDIGGLTEHFERFLADYRPDVINFHHVMGFGVQALRAARRALGDVPIVYTLHEYLPICHRHGQMVRTDGDELCLEASPRRCHGCFPDIPPREFHLRERFVKSHFEDVDLFIAPSRFLMERYLDWGIEPDRIINEDYGRHPVKRAPDAERPGRRNRVGFFGQFSHYKGVNVLLRAMTMMPEGDADIRAWLHGANLDIQPEDFQEEFGILLRAAGDAVVMAGRYEAHELPQLMQQIDWVVVPSRWWENSPLVIQEAFAHGRPVICSDIGGMAEKIVDGVNGLHFRVGDAISLAETIRTAVRDEELWSRLREEISPPHSMDKHVRRLEGIYNDLLARPDRRPASGDVPQGLAS
jgi:glycosyltransferase involved in cell wall biosynthesis